MRRARVEHGEEGAVRRLRSEPFHHRIGRGPAWPRDPGLEATVGGVPWRGHDGHALEPAVQPVVGAEARRGVHGEGARAVAVVAEDFGEDGDLGDEALVPAQHPGAAPEAARQHGREAGEGEVRGGVGPVEADSVPGDRVDRGGEPRVRAVDPDVVLPERADGDEDDVAAGAQGVGAGHGAGLGRGEVEADGPGGHGSGRRQVGEVGGGGGPAPLRNASPGGCDGCGAVGGSAPDELPDPVPERAHPHDRQRDPDPLRDLPTRATSRPHDTSLTTPSPTRGSVSVPPPGTW